MLRALLDGRSDNTAPLVYAARTTQP